MSNFFQNLFGNNDKKKSGGQAQQQGGGSVGGPKNPFANVKLNMPGQKFQGSGQSLGGNAPGKLIPINLEMEGPLGLKVERRPNGQGTAIVSMVVEGSQAEAAGLKRGDILCFAGSEGKSEIPYDDFLQMARSNQRPIVFEARRIASSTGDSTTSDTNKSADAYARKQAVIAAAEARDKANKKWSKPVGKGKTDKKLSEEERRKKELEMERDAQLRQQEAPRSEEARQAMEAAKKSEADWASQLGYNPYETNKVTAGQARNATVTSQHGSVSDGTGSDTKEQPIPNVQPPTNPSTAADDERDESDAMLLSQIPQFDEAYTTMVTTNAHDDVVASFNIIRKLVVNATTKGQDATSEEEEAAAKFRRVRLANPKIKSAVVDVNGGLDLMMALGFQLFEEDGESFLAFPLGNTGPDFLPAALRQMERYEKS